MSMWVPMPTRHSLAVLLSAYPRDPWIRTTELGARFNCAFDRDFLTEAFGESSDHMARVYHVRVFTAQGRPA